MATFIISCFIKVNSHRARSKVLPHLENKQSYYVEFGSPRAHLRHRGIYRATPYEVMKLRADKKLRGKWSQLRAPYDDLQPTIRMG